MWPVKRILKYGFITATITGTAASLHSNEYNINSLGLVRIGRAAVTVFKISINYQQNLYSTEAKKLDPKSMEYQNLRSETHRTSAEKLLDLCRENKGVYIKVGQHIAALEYLVPSEYISVMKVLHSQAPCSTLEEVHKVIKEDFKCEPEKIFSSIDPEPLGTASLAQVHKAQLRDGTVVALKVQHPRVKANSLVDIKTMEILATIVQWVFPDFNMTWLVEETKINLPLELDFEKEAENTERAKKMFQCFPWLKVPDVVWKLTTPRVLTMEYLEGGQINDLEYMKNNDISPTDVSDKLGHLYSRMIFNEGFVHSDPHPGNILVHKSKSGSADIILLDHGLYATLSDDFRWSYAKLWLCILNKDIDGMKEYCTQLGVGRMYAIFSCMVSGRTWESIQAGLSKTKYSIEEKAKFQENIPNFISHILSVLANVNRQMILILKTNDLIRGIEHTLQTQSRSISFRVMSECCIRCIYNERLHDCEGRFARLRVILEQNWMLLKLNLYYMYLSVTNLFS